MSTERMTDDRWSELSIRSSEWTQAEQLEVEAELTRARSFETIPQRAIAHTELDALHMEANLDDARRDRNMAWMTISHMLGYLGGSAESSPIDRARYANYERHVAQETVTAQANQLRQKDEQIRSLTEERDQERNIVDLFFHGIKAGHLTNGERMAEALATVEAWIEHGRKP